MYVVRFRDVERQILQQHEEIRARLRGLTRDAERADIPWALGALQLLLLRFAADFDAHLSFEERELAPRIREIDAWGKVREEALLAEHREQRSGLERVCAVVEDPTAAETTCLFDLVSELAETLLADMLHEERALAELARIDEDGHTDQMTG